MYVLDTNAYSALDRNPAAIAPVVINEPALGIALPVLAELRYGFVRGDRPDANERDLQVFLAQPNVSVLFPTVETTRHYAEIQRFCTAHGRALSQNDIWIAALVRESGDTLLTFDRDFAAVQDLLDGRLRLLGIE